MHHVTIRTLVLVILLLLLAGPAAVGAEEPGTGPAPAWTRTLEAPLDRSRDNDELYGGFHYLLFDQQYHVPDEEFFNHHVFRVVTQEGVADMSDITAEYDPSHQTLVFHTLILHRDGRALDQLADHPIRTFQREEGMEANLYDGTLTAVIHLGNVRVGDVIEYSYTIKGRNPVFEGRMFSHEPLDYMVPVEKIHLSILAEPGYPLHFRTSNGASMPNRRNVGDLVEYSWTLDDVPARLLEDNLPYWFDPFAAVDISSFDQWSQVVAWALPYYTIGAEDRAALARLLDDIAPGTALDERILQAIRFVQDEIRYLGMENGLGAFVPRPAPEVHRRRYGDCKDKSLLLAGLLQELGVEARPMLVNPYSGRVLDKHIPSPYAFNHCIVAFDHGGHRYFVDPTLSLQGGDLDHMATPRYHHGLEIGEDVTDLTAFPVTDPPSQEFVYHYEVGEIGEPVAMTVRSTFQGLAADRQRDSFQTFSTEELSRHNLDYYSQIFPGIRLESPVRIVDEDRDGKNTVTSHESYVIDDFWAFADEDSSFAQVELFPLELIEYLDLPSSAARTMPFYIGPRCRIKALVQVDMPRDWPFDTESLEVDGKNYSYRSTLDSRARRVEATYEYERLSEYAEAADAAKVINDHTRMFDDLTFYLTDVPRSETQVPQSTLPVFFAMSLVLVGVLALVLHRRYDPEPRAQVEAPRTIGGWLVLPAIGVVFRPLVEIVALIMERDLFDADLIETILATDPDSSASGLILGNSVALFIVAVAIVLSILVIFQFFGKRTSLPRLMVISLVFTLAITAFGFFSTVGGEPYEGSANESIDSFRDFASSLFAAMVWIPYFLMSRRVKETFVVRRGGFTSPATMTGDHGITDQPAEAVPPVVETRAAPKRWPASMIVTVVIQLVGLVLMLVIALTATFEGAEPDVESPAAFWTGTLIAYGILIIPPVTGAVAILRRRTWARTFQLVTLGVLCFGLVAAIAFMATLSVDPDASDTAMGFGLFLIPALALFLVQLFAPGAKTFPPEYRGLASLDPAPDSTAEADDLCRRLIVDRFRALKIQFGSLAMEITEDEEHHNAALVIPEQDGVPLSIVVEMKNGQNLNLYLGEAHLSWSPCSRIDVRESFFNVVSGIFSGSLRLTEFLHEGRVMALHVQEQHPRGWVNRYQWQSPEAGFVQGLQERVVVIRPYSP